MPRLAAVWGMPIAGQDGFPCRARGRCWARLRARQQYDPILIEGVPERVEVERTGWEIAEGGMEIVL